MSTLAAPGRARRRLRVAGVVQGVGFRPFVYRLAGELGLAGFVGNDCDGVFAEVEGAPEAIEDFESRVVAQAPPLARIAKVESIAIPPVGARGFSVVSSHEDGPVRTFVSPDVATCDDCLAEMFDPTDRRFRYPFVNCTNCGPRFTITMRLPYDRPNTTMRRFALCPACAAEYEDPGDRRFHAQPVACPRCGPHLWWEPRGGDPAAPDVDAALKAAQGAWASGGIVAVKGLGGYHLACDALDSSAVERLRARKHREAKPFAVMVRDLAAARALAFVSDAEAALLESAGRPIVLVERRAEASICDGVAPDNPRLGIMLPYTPLHHLLFEPVPGGGTPVPQALVMTSGNLSEEPICYRDDDARRRLGGMVDGWLVHDRPIHVPCDDSVLRVVDGEELPLRRSRGYAPLPAELPFDAPALLAVGGELKNTFCLASGGQGWLSQHIGDLGSVASRQAFQRSVEQFQTVYDTVPGLLAADLHPGYHSRAWAEDHAGEPATLELVQHHHAHVAAVLAEHQLPLETEVIGFAFDGTGYGEDGAVWGGEVLLGGYRRARRVAHLRYVPLPGGDGAIRKPYRMALAHLYAAGIDWSADLPPVRAAGTELDGLGRQLERRLACVPTSSMGRLFDAVSSLLGICQLAGYEAQAAVSLEAAAEHYLATGPPEPVAGPPAVLRFAARGEELDPAPVLSGLLRGRASGRPAGALAADFHQAVAEMIADTAEELRRRTGVDQVVLSGGVFQNGVLIRLARAALRRRAMRVYTSHMVPPGDGGLALGQAVVAAARHSQREGDGRKW